MTVGNVMKFIESMNNPVCDDDKRESELDGCLESHLAYSVDRLLRPAVVRIVPGVFRR